MSPSELCSQTSMPNIFGRVVVGEATPSPSVSEFVFTDTFTSLLLNYVHKYTDIYDATRSFPLRTNKSKITNFQAIP